MLIDNQKVKIKISKRNKNWYANKGYDISNSEILVDIKDLTKGAKTYVEVRCDYCKKKFTRLWGDYYKVMNEKDACIKCKLKKQVKTHLYKDHSIYMIKQMNFVF